MLLGLLIALLLLIGWLAPNQTVVGVVLDLLVITAALMVHVVLHEAAHALSALALGMRVPEVALGDGRSGVKLRLGGTTLLVGAMHTGGATPP